MTSHKQVVYVVNTETGAQWTCHSVDEAEAFIADREAIDPDGVFRGDYQIDDMMVGL